MFILWFPERKCVTDNVGNKWNLFDCDECVILLLVIFEWYM